MFYAVGNSLLAAAGVGLTNLANRCVALLHADFGGSLDNMASNGHAVPDQAFPLVTRNITASDRVLFGLGTNERDNGGGSAAKRGYFIDGLRAMVMWCCAFFEEIGTASGWTETGTWVSFSAGYNTRGSYFNGAKLTRTFTGTACMLSSIRQVNNTSYFNVKIDGVLDPRCPFLTGGAIYGLTVGYGPMGILFDGLASGSHTIEIEIFSDGIHPAFMHRFSTLSPKAKVVMLNIANNKDGSDAADIAAYNADMLVLAGEFQTLSLPVEYADVNAKIDSSKMADIRHWNDGGQCEARNVSYECFTGTPAPVVMLTGGAVQFGSDGEAYLSFPGFSKKIT